MCSSKPHVPYAKVGAVALPGKAQVFQSRGEKLPAGKKEQVKTTVRGGEKPVFCKPGGVQGAARRKRVFFGGRIRPENQQGRVWEGFHSNNRKGRM